MTSVVLLDMPATCVKVGRRCVTCCVVVVVVAVVAVVVCMTHVLCLACPPV